MNNRDAEKINGSNASFSSIDMKAIGNYTKDAVKNFENNIVNQTNYLEKVNSKLDDKQDD